MCGVSRLRAGVCGWWWLGSSCSACAALARNGQTHTACWACIGGCEVMQCRSSSSSDGGVVLHTRAIQRDSPPWLGSFIPRASSCCCVSALSCAMAWLAAKSLWSDTKRAEQSGASNPYKNANAPIKLGVSDRALFVRHHRMRCGG